MVAVGHDKNSSFPLIEQLFLSKFVVILYFDCSERVVEVDLVEVVVVVVGVVMSKPRQINKTIILNNSVKIKLSFMRNQRNISGKFRCYNRKVSIKWLIRW